MTIELPTKEKLTKLRADIEKAPESPHKKAALAKIDKQLAGLEKRESTPKKA